MEKVFGYIRVSTKTQVDKGFGLKTQRQAIVSYCKRHNLELVQVFVDEGVSGTNIERTGLTDLLTSFNGIRKVVVLNTSRLWRDGMAKAFIQKTLLQLKADVISVEQNNYSLYNDNDPNDFLVNGILELLDQYERLHINLKLAKGRKTKAKSGLKACGNAPLGYQWVDAKIEVNPDEAETVNDIFNLYMELGSIGKLKEHLDSRGYVSRKGNSFSKQALKDILTNDFYIGAVTHGTVKTTGQHKSLVAPQFFKQVQSRLFANRRNLCN